MKKMLFPAILAITLLLSATALAADEDAHFIQSDDFFVSKEAYKNQDWIYVSLAKQTKAPSAATKNEGQFLQVTDGKSVWTKNFWSTRIALAEDLVIGAIVIMPELSGDEDTYRAPENKDEARESAWFLAKITDISDLYKDFVTVSGGYKVRVDAMRVITTPGK